MSQNYDENKPQKVANLLAPLIKEKYASENKAEAEKELRHLVYTCNTYGLWWGRILNNLETSDPAEDFTKLKNHVSKAIQKTQDLSLFSELDLKQQTQAFEFLGPYERILANLSEVEDILNHSIDTCPPKKTGRPQQNSHDMLIELNLQVLEQAYDFSFDVLKNRSDHSKNQIMTKFYNLLEIYFPSFSPDSLRKRCQRYIQSGRPLREEVLEVLQDELAT